MFLFPNYSIRFFKNIIVSSGEDRCLLLWSKGQHLQTITLPSRSIWAIQLLSNSDIVTGSKCVVLYKYFLAIKIIACLFINLFCLIL